MILSLGFGQAHCALTNDEISLTVALEKFEAKLSLIIFTRSSLSSLLTYLPSLSVFAVTPW